jgi:transcriptional regulator of arginine metabolism
MQNPKVSYSKESRQGRIRALISERSVETQSQLAKILKKEGFDVTQSSVSRDLEEIGVVKIQGAYALPMSMGAGPKFRLLQIRPAGDALLVLKCEPGFASAMSAEIDNLNLPGIVGTIAGDDTIFVAVSARNFQMNVLETLQRSFPL